MGGMGKPPIDGQTWIYRPGSDTWVTGTTGPSRVPGDSFTLHNWVMNESGSSPTFADTGTGANAPLLNLAGTVTAGEVGIFGDCTYFTPNASAKSNNAVGNPTSTTQISIHGWAKIREFALQGTSNTGPRFITKGYNTAFNPPYVSIDFYTSGQATVSSGSSGTGGAIQIQWTTGGTLKTDSILSGRGILQKGQWYHLGVTFSVVSSNMIVCVYVNGALVNQSSTASGGIDWNGASSGPWALGGVNGGFGSACMDGWLHDWRVDDGIVRSPTYFKNLYKRAMGLPY